MGKILSAPMAGTGKRRSLAEAGLIVAACIAAYAPVLQAGFIWNDSDYVTAASLRSWSGLGKIWFQLGATEQYYPLLHSAFWLEHLLWGDAPLGYHLLNVALHATSAVLLLALLRKLAVPGAWLAALVFALHPVCVESVAWVSEQKNTLSTVLYLAAALGYFRFVDHRTRSRYAAATLFFGLAIMTKSVAATLPAALLVVRWWQTGRVSWRRDIGPLSPWLVLGVAAGFFSGWVERHYVGAEGSAFALTDLDRLLLASHAVWFYAAKLAWPAELIFFYPRWEITSASLASYGYLVAVLAVFGGLVAIRHRTRAPLAGALLFAGTLLPTLGFFNIYAFIFSYVADHWQYLACIGLIAPVCAGLTLLARHFHPSLQITAATILLGGLGILTWRQAGMYQNMETFYRTTLAKNPAAWMAHNNLGVYLREQRKAGAQVEFEAALKVRADYVPAHYNLGVCLLDAGHPLQAVEQLQLAAGSRHRDNVHLYLGEALSDLHRYAEAATQYNIHTQLEPTNAKAWAGLASALAQEGKNTEATSSFATAERLDPKDPELAFALGDTLLALERYPAAAAAYRRGLVLAPDRAYAHANLGSILITQGEIAAAVTEYRAALRARPGDPQLVECLRRALELSSSSAAPDHPTTATHQ